MRSKKCIVLAKGVLLAASCTSGMAQTAPPEHSIREAETRTGSIIRQTISQGSGVPINKKYEELTPEEKESLDQFYETMGPGDEPPFPAEGLKPIHLALAKAQKALLVTGDLFLIATVDHEGNVTQVKAIGNPSPEMTKFGATVLSLTKFKPALCKGAPCKMDYPFRFHFSVR